jgi:hypothetical protein
MSTYVHARMHACTHAFSLTVLVPVRFFVFISYFLLLYADWDFFNNIGYLHVNWVPADSRLKIIDQKQNENLILEELSRIYKQRKLHYNIDK